MLTYRFIVCNSEEEATTATDDDVAQQQVKKKTYTRAASKLQPISEEPAVQLSTPSSSPLTTPLKNEKSKRTTKKNLSSKKKQLKERQLDEDFEVAGHLTIDPVVRRKTR